MGYIHQEEFVTDPAPYKKGKTNKPTRLLVLPCLRVYTHHTRQVGTSKVTFLLPS
jgi:hypothetical protein